MIEDLQIARVIHENRSDLERTVDQLTEAANWAGGEDNMTAMLIECGREGE